MGDHRSASGDSLEHWQQSGRNIDSATIPEGEVVGRAFTVFWPFDRATWLTVPKSFDGIPHPDRGETTGAWPSVGAVWQADAVTDLPPPACGPRAARRRVRPGAAVRGHRSGPSGAPVLVHPRRWARRRRSPRRPGRPGSWPRRPGCGSTPAELGGSVRTETTEFPSTACGTARNRSSSWSGCPPGRWTRPASTRSSGPASPGTAGGRRPSWRDTAERFYPADLAVLLTQVLAAAPASEASC